MSESWAGLRDFLVASVIVMAVVFAILFAGAGFGAVTGWDMDPPGLVR